MGPMRVLKVRVQVERLNVKQLKDLLISGGARRTTGLRKSEMQANVLELLESKKLSVEQLPNCIEGENSTSNGAEQKLTLERQESCTAALALTPQTHTHAILEPEESTLKDGKVQAFAGSPFFEVLDVIVEPTPLLACHTFALTFDQAVAYLRDDVEVYMRFAVISSMPKQYDIYPETLTVMANNKVVLERHPKQKALSTPVTLTNALDLCTNKLSMTWSSVLDQKFEVAIYLVKKISAEHLLWKVGNNDVIRDRTTIEMISKILTVTDSEVCSPTSIRVTATCPIGKRRMVLPCRPITCSHPQCFDVKTFLQMQETKPFGPFKCPVCNTSVKFEDLKICEYFKNIVNDLSAEDENANGIILHPEGKWSLVSKKEGCEKVLTGSEAASSNDVREIMLD